MSYDKEALRDEMIAELKESASKTVLEDSRALRFLNRAERQHYKKRNGGLATMKLNLLTPVEAQDADGTMIMQPEKAGGGIPSLKSMILFVLRQVIQDDQRQTEKYKKDQYLLIRRVDKVDEIELTAPERQLLVDRAYKILLQPELRGRVIELLESGENEGANTEVPKP